MLNTKNFKLIFLFILISNINTLADINHEIRNTYFIETYSFNNKNTVGTSLSYMYLKLKNTVLFTNIILQNKSDKDETLQTLGGAYTINNYFAIQETIGFSNNKWTLPKYFFDTELSYNTQKNIHFSLGYKLNAFEDIDVNIISIGSTYVLSQKLSFNLKLFHAISNFKSNSLKGTNDSFFFKTDYIPDNKNSFSIGYIKNSESYINIEKVNNFKADTFIFNWKKYLKENLWLLTGFGYQKRSKPITADQNNLEIGFIYQW